MKLAKNLAMIAALALLVSCGGKSKPPIGGDPGPNPTPAKIRATLSPIGGTHATVAKKTTAYSFSLVDRAWAQTTSIALDQSFNGFCNSNPLGVGQNYTIVLYGGGQMNSQSCEQGPWTFTESDAPLNASSGLLMIGAGTVGNLVVWSGKGTHTTSSDSGKVHIWIQRGTSIVDTNVFCILGSAQGYAKCSSGSTFAVQDGDQAVVTVTLAPGDVITGLNFLFTKAQ